MASVSTVARLKHTSIGFIPYPKKFPSGLNLHTDTVLPFLGSKALRRCLESLSQKWKFPSEPAVAKVPYLWKAIEFTEYTAACVP